MWPIGIVFCNSIFEIKAQCANAVGEDFWFIIEILTESSIGSLHPAITALPLTIEFRGIPKSLIL